jgi:hypothetical protein
VNSIQDKRLLVVTITAKKQTENSRGYVYCVIVNLKSKGLKRKLHPSYRDFVSHYFIRYRAHKSKNINYYVESGVGLQV